ncbi:hypothetical protein QBC34DRAFT_442622 [Podospora aff. communis PSN243]|uniref:Uncharacterized protein n=1 Tax=Podospora aff. communis PSN243 TaxID=3040156 RepID=A0AAV9G8B0_9PEZI|nr:hypothetical protein QBC34DRAFT_442622 [Podospora aff. communis PSN243]
MDQQRTRSAAQAVVKAIDNVPLDDLRNTLRTTAVNNPAFRTSLLRGLANYKRRKHHREILKEKLNKRCDRCNNSNGCAPTSTKHPNPRCRYHPEALVQTLSSTPWHDQTYWGWYSTAQDHQTDHPDAWVRPCCGKGIHSKGCQLIDPPTIHPLLLQSAAFSYPPPTSEAYKSHPFSRPNLKLVAIPYRPYLHAPPRKLNALAAVKRLPPGAKGYRRPNPKLVAVPGPPDVFPRPPTNLPSGVRAAVKRIPPGAKGYRRPNPKLVAIPGPPDVFPRPPTTLPSGVKAAVKRWPVGSKGFRERR